MGFFMNLIRQYAHQAYNSVCTIFSLFPIGTDQVTQSCKICMTPRSSVTQNKFDYRFRIQRFLAAMGVRID